MQVSIPDYQVQEALCLMNGNVDKSRDEIVLLTNKLEDICLVEGQKENKVLLDCACPNTVAGVTWMKNYISQLSSKQRQKVEVSASQRVYKFGGGEMRPSKCVVAIPCHLAGKNVSIRSEVVEADIPLLLGNSSLKKAKAVLHISEAKIELMGEKVDLMETNSGHFSIEVNLPKDWDEAELCLVIQQEELTKEKLKKLHQYFCHCSVDKLTKLIKNAGRLQVETKRYLEEIKAGCLSCKIWNNRLPTPVVTIPRASRCNELVTVDLKDWCEGKCRYILYIIDNFSRLAAASFIPNKQAVTVGEQILAKWISVFGVMSILHLDRGSEFLNEEMTALC